MATGPGKYDDLCTYARTQADALGCALIIFEGKHGAGFAVQATPHLTARLPKILRTMADEIEKDVARGLFGYEGN